MAATIFAFQYDDPIDDVFAGFVDYVLAAGWHIVYDVQNQVELSAKQFPYTVVFFEKSEVVDPDTDDLNKAFGNPTPFHYTYKNAEEHQARLDAHAAGEAYEPPD